ncbi:glycosyl hydrolase family 10 [Fusarium albosuccineum]|uniref:Beta-xylanase n=1 Tax=Fusarium albosuccineum TaxID=1237068 RepID=A0A8H4NSK2_9HYPO|nr:glycosyl hydrolase family 10 [Fusarium albosuccineum]
MKAAVSLFLFSLASALPTAYLELDDELAARRVNITEREATLEERQASVSIHDLFKNKGKVYFGTATDRGLLTSGKNAAIIQANFGQGSFNFANSDYLVDWAVQNSKSIRGHTLVWHSQLPQWVKNINNANTLREVIRTHVKTVVGRYKNKIRAWDVVNEIFNEDGTIRSSVFSNLLGEEFVSIAFKAAREADPSARLYINDYNLDRAGSSKVNLMRYYVDKWISEGVPIDGIGTQAHLTGGQGSAIQGALEQLATAPVTEIAITELDIAQAPTSDYVSVVQGCLRVSKCCGITVWGISDKDSWRAGTNPLLFDNNYNPKSAYQGIVDLLR